MSLLRMHTVADLNISITTFNAGRELIDVDYFASSLYTTLKPGTLPPDLIVLSLQEIAPLGYSFLGGSLLAPFLSRFVGAVTRAAQWAFGKDADYEHVVTRSAGMTGIVVFGRRTVRERTKWIEAAGTGVGIWEMGNKGAVGVRIALESAGADDEDVLLTFVAAHLAPMEKAWERRNEDWENICQTLVFEPVDKRNANVTEGQPLLGNDDSTSGPHGMYDPPSHLFIAGDLNYRTSDSQPDPKDFESWPQPMQSDSGTAHYTKLLDKDQLTRELKANRTLHGLTEAPITFPPTYKYSSRAQSLARETAKARSQNTKDDESVSPTIDLSDIQEQVYLWAKHRIPSWCDRILFLESAKPQVHSYTALPVQPTSDHRPVVLSCSVPDKAVTEAVTAPFDIAKDWKIRREFAKRVEVAVGVGGYLGFTGQGRVLTAGTLVGVIVGYLALRYMLGY
ncbi:Type II inositol polyphosphate 5-phosphatase 15 [Fulvia fulva]|uniref:Type II inositol polyphosphate 5-phosphatase 15 n=1 Tax=Passalora fulva TaxID=5499 RepID=A0A9Q8LJ80_PASFU|nr:Type II inositol polyphosphate 5-phosphatase 15 [Fulvia fulva]KAK4624589.1 Type II inositol polyphosphate 5-phosphatase 15 [Fulvia fulva]KAK4625231.1 Type II inositol polyphosphate 5-phosphatase 15 [Fulvia fulva]UJO18144.1 Type II inositol polyphosphate 5-phosphatase 15 [Fulvia fulva]WPV15321.1 Type II inositol polyphosphate 5-phosphatase 15 [Fulvia fulva]WPV29868.1 Type II inositol polyphosphate 5-phosphatase 15 [Fulvia fulva]